MAGIPPIRFQNNIPL